MVTKNSFGLPPTVLRAAEPDAMAYQAGPASGSAPFAGRGLRGRSPRLERGGHRSLIG